MKNFISSGNLVTLTAPSGGVVGGRGQLFDKLLVVAVSTEVENALFSGQRLGEVELAKKTADVMTLGQKVNWNDTNDELQNATSDLDNVATVVEAASGSVSLVKVVLTPV